MTLNYNDTLDEEVKTWNIEDPIKRQEKIQRETIRHHKLKKDLLLDELDTANMDICEVGGGPSPVSNLLPFNDRVVFDPCTNEYKKYFNCPDHLNVKIEDVEFVTKFDLVLATNSLDHVEYPYIAMRKMSELCKPGGYIGIVCAENNAITNPHPCHVHNLTSEMVHYCFDRDFETVWELNYKKDNYRYGWVEYQGKRGQPAFAILFRKCTGYE